MQFDRRLGLALLFFLVLFVTLTTAALVRFQNRFRAATSDPPPLAVATADLHTLISGSLVLAGLHPEDIIGEEVILHSEGPSPWKEYRRKILIGDLFPLKGWREELEASLRRAGGRLLYVEESGGLEVRILYAPAGRSVELPVESLSFILRPSPEAIARGKVKNGVRAALVIDDLGQNPAHLQRLVKLGIPFTVSVLPDLPFSRTTAEAAARQNLEVLLHLPMEPFDFPEKHPGPGALLAEMTQDQMRDVLRANLKSVPGAVGVNNHMGSRLTADGRAMESLMGELGARGLFFLDSKTSPRSLAFETAYRHKLPSAQRDIFLDAHDDEEFVRSQIRKLLAMARQEGAAIGIGHPYESTLSVLEEMKGELLDSGVEWVPLSALLVRPGGPEARYYPPAGRPD